MSIPGFLKKTLSGKKLKNKAQILPDQLTHVLSVDTIVLPDEYNYTPGQKKITPVFLPMKSILSETEDPPPADPPGTLRSILPPICYYYYIIPLAKMSNGELFRLNRKDTIMVPYKRDICVFQSIVYGINPGTDPISFLNWRLDFDEIEQKFLSANYYKLNIEKFISFLFEAIYPYGKIKISFSVDSSFDTIFDITDTGIQRVYINLSQKVHNFDRVDISLIPDGVNDMYIWPISLTSDTDNIPLPLDENIIPPR